MEFRDRFRSWGSSRSIPHDVDCPREFAASDTLYGFCDKVSRRFAGGSIWDVEASQVILRKVRVGSTSTPSGLGPDHRQAVCCEQPNPISRARKDRPTLDNPSPGFTAESAQAPQHQPREGKDLPIGVRTGLVGTVVKDAGECLSDFLVLFFLFFFF